MLRQRTRANLQWDAHYAGQSGNPSSALPREQPGGAAHRPVFVWQRASNAGNTFLRRS